VWRVWSEWSDELLGETAIDHNSARGRCHLRVVGVEDDGCVVGGCGQGFYLKR
jgi:hypothetical protein